MSISEQARLAQLKPTNEERQEHIISAIEKRVRSQGGDAAEFVMAVGSYYHADQLNRAHAKALGLLNGPALMERYGRG